jgi:hypothetical protein
MITGTLRNGIEVSKSIPNSKDVVGEETYAKSLGYMDSKVKP